MRGVTQAKESRCANKFRNVLCKWSTWRKRIVTCRQKTQICKQLSKLTNRLFSRWWCQTSLNCRRRLTCWGERTSNFRVSWKGLSRREIVWTGLFCCSSRLSWIRRRSRLRWVSCIKNRLMIWKRTWRGRSICCSWVNNAQALLRRCCWRCRRLILKCRLKSLLRIFCWRIGRLVMWRLRTFSWGRRTHSWLNKTSKCVSSWRMWWHAWKRIKAWVSWRKR